MTEEMRQAIVDLKARQESGEYTLCPRCGEKTMKPVLKSNPSKAISLYNAISPYMVTNIDITELSYLVGQISDYRLNIDEVYSLAGESVTTERYEEFHVDEDALYDLMIKLFYEKVER